MYIALIILGIIWAIIAKNMAEKKGKDGLVWLLLGFLFGLIAIIILACASDKTQRPQSSFDLKESVHRMSEDQKVPKYKCKGCEETIDTLQCPWCGRKKYE